MCFNGIIGSYSSVSCQPYLIFCVLMKWLVDIICWHTIPTLIFVFYKGIGLYPLMSCHPSLTFLCFTKIIDSYSSIPCHPYVIFCVLMKLCGHIIWWYGRRTIVVMFQWIYTTESYNLMTYLTFCVLMRWMSHIVRCHPYLIFCFLMKCNGHILRCHAIRFLFFVFLLG